MTTPAPFLHVSSMSDSNSEISSPAGHLIPPPFPRGWVGVDLDGTLAEFDFDYGTVNLLKIGEPIAGMVDFVQRLLSQGVEVRIFTARVAPHPDRDIDKITMIIRDWCDKHLGRRLPVTCSKDPDCAAIYDDIAFRVLRNGGAPVIARLSRIVGAMEAAYLSLPGSTLTDQAAAAFEHLRIELGMPYRLKLSHVEDSKIIVP